MRYFVLFMQISLGATFGPQEFIRNLKHLSYSTFVILILRNIFTCLSGKLSTEFTSPIAKSTSPGLSDTTFFACCCSNLAHAQVVMYLLNERVFHSFRAIKEKAPSPYVLRWQWGCTSSSLSDEFNVLDGLW